MGLGAVVANLDAGELLLMNERGERIIWFIATAGLLGWAVFMARLFWLTWGM